MKSNQGPNCREAGVAAGACLAAVVGVFSGLPAIGVAVAVAAMPVAGFLLAGHVPGRGSAVGCVGMALGATLIRPEAGGSAWMSVALLAGIGLAAMMGGAWADRMASAQGLATAQTGGRWATIVIECDGPAGGCGRVARPRVSPHPAPERRSVGRLVGERRKGRRPEPSRMA